MNRRSFIAKTGCLALSLQLAGKLQAQETAKVTKPNIVYIIADDLGWNDVGFHGSEIRTPNIDKVAKEGIMLERFYVCSVCSPTRAGVMSGRYPNRFGIYDGVVRPWNMHGLPPTEFTLAEMLGEAGYKTRAMIGKWHLGHASTMFHPLRRGFTSFYGHYNGALDYFTHKREGQLDWHRDYDSSYDKGYSTDLLGQEAVKIINDSKPDSPFYIHVCFNAVHTPLQAKKEDLDAYGFDPKKGRSKNVDAELAQQEGTPDYGNKGRGNTNRQTYAAMDSAMDIQIGKILDAIDKKGLRDNTIVIFHSDNGGAPKAGASNLPLKGGKFTTWEGGVRVAAALRWPSQIKGGRKFDTMMAYIDMWPTLAAAAGYTGNVPNKLDGINMLPVLKSEKTAPDRYILLGQDSVVTQEWKLVKDSLYNVVSDTSEKEDVAKEHPDIVKKLKAYVSEFKKIEGPVYESSLPKPATWPPVEWKLPEESFTKTKQKS